MSANPNLDEVEVADWTDDARILFSTAQITRLICVDDRAGVAETGDFKGLAGAIRDGRLPLDVAIREIAAGGPNEDVSTYDQDELADYVNEGISNLPVMSDVLRKYVEVDGDDGDAATIRALRHVAKQSSLEFEVLNLGEWKSRKDELTVSGSLVLFDKDMSLDDEGTDTSGVELLIAALSTPESGVRAALFTHSIAIGQEYDEWKRLAQDHADVSERMLVISKHSLSDPEYASFITGLKVLLVAPEISRIISRVSDLHHSVTAAALKKLRTFSPYTLDRMFVGAIENEGEWGPENFYSYVDAVQRKELRQDLHRDVTINSSITSLRSLASMKLKLPNPTQVEYIEVQRARKMDDSEHINAVRLPIDTGDIFRIHAPSGNPKNVWSDELYILLIQRCDITLRAGSNPPGARNFNPKLLPLYRINKVRSDRPPRNDTRLAYQLPYLVPDSTQVYEITFGDRIMIPAMALDFCTLNGTGESSFALGNDYEASGGGLALASREAASRYREKVASIVARYSATLEKTSDAQVLKDVTAALSGASDDWSKLRAEISVKEQRLKYGIRRIARLRDPDMQDALDQLSSVQGRIALNAHMHLDAEHAG
jgi:hypothetical protein